MSKSGRLESLNARHRQIDEKIHALESAPGACSTQISALKREKLSIKDEISTLSESETV